MLDPQGKRRKGSLFLYMEVRTDDGDEEVKMGRGILERTGQVVLEG
jgi:hypothetical protein